MFDRLIDFVNQWLHALVFWHIIEPYERGLQLRMGRLVKELDPGLHWIMPFHVDTVVSENVVPRTERITGLATTTADGKSVGFDAIVTYRISDIQKAMLEVNDLKDAIADTCAGMIGTSLSNATWEQIRHGEAVDALTAACRKKGWKWGVEIQGVQLVGIALVRNLRLSISAPPHTTHIIN